MTYSEGQLGTINSIFNCTHLYWPEISGYADMRISGSEKVVYNASALYKQNIFVRSDFLPDCGELVYRGSVRRVLPVSSNTNQSTTYTSIAGTKFNLHTAFHRRYRT